MAHWICDQCGVGFKRDKQGARVIRFCSQACYHLWREQTGASNTGQFKSGHKTWNKGKKGLHLSPESEFKKGHISNRKLPVGAVVIRMRKRDNKQRKWIKIGNPNIWQIHCHYVWEQTYGKISKGLLIHHIDRDTMNDDLNNLALISRAAHLNEHRPEMRIGSKHRLDAAKSSLSLAESTAGQLPLFPQDGGKK